MTTGGRDGAILILVTGAMTGATEAITVATGATPDETGEARAGIEAMVPLSAIPGIETAAISRTIATIIRG
jgi:hypothetical protein